MSIVGSVAGMDETQKVVRTESDQTWNEAIDWLLNSRHCADPGIQAAFWGIAEGKCTRKNVEEWVAGGAGQEFT